MSGAAATTGTTNAIGVPQLPGFVEAQRELEDGYQGRPAAESVTSYSSFAAWERTEYDRSRARLSEYWQAQLEGYRGLGLPTAAGVVM